VILEARKLAKRLAWHAVAYQSIATAEEGEDALREAASDTLHQTVDVLACLLDDLEMLKIADELPKSEVEASWPAKEARDFKEALRVAFVARLLESAEVYVEDYISQKLIEPSKKLERPK